MARRDKPIAVGLLSQSDLDRLGAGFKLHYPIPEDGGQFADLLARLDSLTGCDDDASEAR